MAWPNIDRGARKGEYVGFARGVAWNIRRKPQRDYYETWIVTPLEPCGAETFTARTLFFVHRKLERLDQ